MFVSKPCGLANRDWAAGDPLTQEVFGRQYIWNLFSHNSAVMPNGYNEEENKMMQETDKIFGVHIPVAVGVFIAPPASVSFQSDLCLATGLLL